MTKLTRKHLYEEDYQFIMDWGRDQVKEEIFRTPNNKENFPFYLTKYLDQLRFQKN